MLIEKVDNFNRAYDAYYSSLEGHVQSKMKVLEIGGGAHPSIKDRQMIQYHIVDSDEIELAKSPEDVEKFHGKVEDLSDQIEYDLIMSKMVLEHIPNPDEFHKKVKELLRPDGRAIHFFACRHSIPALVNRLFPESVGDALLKLLKNRNTDDHPKYSAFYKRTKGGLSSQINYFKRLGYEVEMYNSYVGHKYFRSIPILKHLEQLYTWLLVQLKIKALSTVALVILKHR